MSDYNNGTDTVIVEKKVLNKNFRLHWHDYYEIEYVLDGSGKEILNGKEIEIHKGVLNIISPSDFHEIIVDAPITLVKIYFDISILDPTLFSEVSNLLDGRFINLCGKDKELYDSLFLTLILQKELYEKSDSYQLIMKNSLKSILLTTAEYIRKNCDMQTYDKQRLSSALAYIHANFKKHITLTRVANQVHFSEAYFSRHFHESLGMTFSQYVKKLRMEFAAGLLLNSDMEITNICYESGFSSPQSFSNEFKKIYKLTPSEYRKSKI